MKKKILFIVNLLLITVLFITSCGQSTTQNAGNDDQEQKNIIIATSSISNDVLEVAVDKFHEIQDEYSIEIKVFDDAVAPNTALAEGSVNATFHQYEKYMENYNNEYNTNLKIYGPEIFAFQIGLYSNKYDSIDKFDEGMTIAISNDASNRALGLQLLEEQGVISLDPNVELPNILDITDNPLNINFVEMERLNLANAVDDTDAAIVMTDVIKEAGKNPEDALAFAQEPGIYLVINEEEPWMERFVNEALTSDEVRTYIDEETNATKKSLF